MTATALQNLLHGLQVGVAIPGSGIDLKQFMGTPGATFSIVGTSNVWNSATLLPPGLTLSSAGVLTGTPTTIGVTAVKVRAVLGTRDPEASWTARTPSSVYTKQRFDNPASSIGVSQYDHNVNYDTTVKRSGAGSLHMATPLGTSQDAKWSYSMRVQQDQGAQGFASNHGFAPGEEFYLQFALYTDRNYVQYPWPEWGKVFILDGFAYQPNQNLAPTANPWEHVLIPGHGMLHGYTNGNEGWAWFNGTWPGGVGVQPSPINAQGHVVYDTNVKNTARVLNGDNPSLPSGAGATWTANQQERARNGFVKEVYRDLGHPDGLPDPLASGGSLSVGAWHTILVHMKLANTPIQTDADGRWWLSSGGIYQVWMAQDGQDYQLLYDNQNHKLRVTPGTTSPNWFQRTSPTFINPPGFSLTETFYGIAFTNLFFGLDISAGPLQQQWIDEIICSPNLIPAPDFDGTGTYRTADAIITFKVAAAPAVTYQTFFTATEYPMVDGGVWNRGHTEGGFWQDPETVSGHAVAHFQAGTSGSGSMYDDMIAVLKTSSYAFTPNQYAQATVYKAAGYVATVNGHEIELHLRCAFAHNDIRSYEVLIGIAPQGPYFGVNRWDAGVINGNYSPVTMTIVNALTVINDGDVIRAEIVGSVITVKKNGQEIGHGTDTVLIGGQPGFGAWCSGGTLASFGWTDWSAGNL